MTTSAEIGSVQVNDTYDYDLPAGFVIEEFDGEYWSIPDWTERGMGHWDGVFPTRDAALAALRAA